MAKVKSTTKNKARLQTSEVGALLKRAYLPLFRGRFALEVDTDAMAPRYERGEWVAIDASMPIVPGDDVVVLLPRGKGGDLNSVTGLLRRFVGIQGGDLILKRLNPEQQTLFPLSDVRGVIGVYAAGERDAIAPQAVPILGTASV